MHTATEASHAFHRLVLYHAALETPPGQAMARFLAALQAGGDPSGDYLHLVRTLWATPPGPQLAGDGWQNHLLGRILADDNPFTRAAARGPVEPALAAAAAHDLRLLQRLFALTRRACRTLAGDDRLPLWPGRPDPGEGNPAPPAAPGPNPAEPALREAAAALAAAADWGACVAQLAAFHHAAGAGPAACHWVFRWGRGGLAAVAAPDLCDLDQLVGLADAKATVLRNTEQFLRGAPANNLLLYGSRGTGKSSMIRSLPGRYGPHRLRLVEADRQAMGRLDRLFRQLRDRPERYIIFLDDLSFAEDDPDYKRFKSLVEGGLEQQPGNVLLYATSNRRHLLPQRWSDRNTAEVAEVHGQDAMEEKLSLADRFGITVLFATPTQEEYLTMVEQMAARRGLAMGREELRAAALRWVLWHNPPSGRAARQFVDDLAGRLSLG